MPIITTQKLIDADKDADSWDTAISGGEYEMVLTRRGKTYPTVPNGMRQLLENGGFRPMISEAAIKAYVPTVIPSAAKDMSTMKIWWYGVDEEKGEKVPSWHDTGLSELDRANAHTDSLIKDVMVVDGGSINALKNIGNYLLLSTSTYTDLPPPFTLNENAVVRVLAVADDFFEQALHRINEPNLVWTRTCRASDGVGIWREPTRRFLGVFDKTDPMDLTHDGTYVLTNPINTPTGFLGSATLSIDSTGGFNERTITQTGTTTKKWKKINNGAWENAAPHPFTLTNDRFSPSYNFRGLFTDVDVDSLVSEGNYLVNGKYINGAPSIGGTQLIKVGVFGAFRWQVSSSITSSDKQEQRFAQLISSKYVWGEWSGIGGSSGGDSGSSISGKSIAFIGDSIVEQGDYPERIGERFGATVHKFGFGGCRAGRYASNPEGYGKQSLYQIAKCINTDDYTVLIEGAEWTRDNRSDDNTPQALAMRDLDWSKVDILCIAFGTNDWTGNPLGADLTPDSEGKTFKGAMAYSVEQIQTKYPHLQIILIGMSFRLRTTAGGLSDNSDDVATINGYLKEYQQAILEVGDKYHIPVFNMYDKSGVNRYNYTYYLRDGIHPNTTGNQHWANKIGSFLSSNI